MDPNYIQDIVPEDEFFKDVKQDDLIVVIMGMTGAGKSTFINDFFDQALAKVNHGLRSCTKEIGVAIGNLPSTHKSWPSRRLVLVDTPGFDDTDDGEFEILRRISVWLADVYQKEVEITGLVYLHNIGHNRMCGSSLLSHNIFRRMCGANAFNRVVMASTQWETITTRNKAAGPIRENDLKEFWKKTLDEGAVYMRVGGSEAEDERRGGTQRVIDHILKNHAVSTRIQEELVNLNKRVKETDAAQELTETLEKWLGDCQIQELSEEKEEELKKISNEPGLLDWVKGLFRLKRNPDTARVEPKVLD
ncbi:hypothetical protein MD484_g5113, partial [Candolleomyces efflorescens]